MHKKLALFPMTRDMCAVARYASLLVGYSLHKLFIPPFSNYNGSDINVIDGGDATGLLLEKYADNDLNTCDVLFVDYDENIKTTDIYTDVINKAEKMGKEIIISKKLKQKLSMKYSSDEKQVVMKINPETDRLYEVKIPVITVLTQGIRTDQYATELALRAHFINSGYRVSQIGSYCASLLFGFNGLPDFIYENRDSYEKILLFNRYVHEIINNENPDILIMGVPDAIMKYNNQILNGMGLVPYVVCNAVNSDLSVLCTYYGKYTKQYFEETSQFGNFCHNTPIELFNIANTAFAPEMIDEVPKLKFIEVNSNFVMETIDEISADAFVLFNALNEGSIKNACKTINDMLTSNVCIM